MKTTTTTTDGAVLYPANRWPAEGIAYTVPVADLARVITSPRLMAYTAEVTHYTATTARVVFTVR